MKPVANSTLLQQLQWRYATRKFDPTKKIPADDWRTLEEALILTPSSIGLQPWKFIVVTDPTVKAQLVTASWNQAQPGDCSHFLVFAVRKNLGVDHIDRHVARVSEVRGAPLESLARYRQMIVRNIDQARDEGRLDAWQTYQIYIALGAFMTAAAMLNIDTCPMEGFQPAKYDELLHLAGTDYASVVACAAGYRIPDEQYALHKKVRFPANEVIVHI